MEKHPDPPSFFLKIQDENRGVDCLRGTKKLILQKKKEEKGLQEGPLYLIKAAFIPELLPLIIDGGKLSRCRPDL